MKESNDGLAPREEKRVSNTQIDILIVCSNIFSFFEKNKTFLHIYFCGIFQFFADKIQNSNCRPQGLEYFKNIVVVKEDI